jgi:hypothetical protein
MAELKTKENDASVEAFLKSIPDEKKSGRLPAGYESNGGGYR